MASDDPYHDRKKYHMAKLFSDNGDVSPVCAERPRKINLKRETWTFRWEAVTCKKCLAKRPPGAVDAWGKEPSP